MVSQGEKEDVQEGELAMKVLDEPPRKKQRFVWSDELHLAFLNAVDQLGIEKAVPKKIMEVMKVPGITRENVASHLQKHRLKIRKKEGAAREKKNPQRQQHQHCKSNVLKPGGQDAVQAPLHAPSSSIPHQTETGQEVHHFNVDYYQGWLDIAVHEPVFPEPLHYDEYNVYYEVLDDLRPQDQQLQILLQEQSLYEQDLDFWQSYYQNPNLNPYPYDQVPDDLRPQDQQLQILLQEQSLYEQDLDFWQSYYQNLNLNPYPYNPEHFGYVDSSIPNPIMDDLIPQHDHHLFGHYSDSIPGVSITPKIEASFRDMKQYSEEKNFFINADIQMDYSLEQDPFVTELMASGGDGQGGELDYQKNQLNQYTTEDAEEDELKDFIF